MVRCDWFKEAQEDIEIRAHSYSNHAPLWRLLANYQVITLSYASTSNITTELRNNTSTSVLINCDIFVSRTFPLYLDTSFYSTRFLRIITTPSNCSPSNRPLNSNKYELVPEAIHPARQVARILPYHWSGCLFSSWDSWLQSWPFESFRSAHKLCSELKREL